MIRYLYNDGGRSAAGYKGEAEDCVVRAIAILTGLPYKEVYRKVAKYNASRGARRSAREGTFVTDTLMAKFDIIRIPQARHAIKPTLTEAHEQHGDLIATTAKHLTAIVGGAMQDTADYREASEYVNNQPTDKKVQRKAMSIWIKKEGAKNVRQS